MAKKHTKNIYHVYTTTDHVWHDVIYRTGLISLMFLMAGFEKFLDIHFSALTYEAVVFAIIGLDLQHAVNRFKNNK